MQASRRLQTQCVPRDIDHLPFILAGSSEPVFFFFEFAIRHLTRGPIELIIKEEE